MLKDVIEIKMPHEVECIIDELKQRQRTMDILLAIRTIQLVGKASEDENLKQLIRLRHELREDLKRIAVKCDSAENEFLSIFRRAFGVNN